MFSQWFCPPLYRGRDWLFRRFWLFDHPTEVLWKSTLLVARHGALPWWGVWWMMMDVFPPWMDWHGSQGSQWHPWRWDSGMATRSFANGSSRSSAVCRKRRSWAMGPRVGRWGWSVPGWEVALAKCRLMGTKYLQQELVKLQYWYDVV